MKRVMMILAVAGLILAVTGTAGANTIASSTMYFNGSLADEGGGIYSGVVAMINEGGEASGYDIYARNGAAARFKDGSDEDPIQNHDGWPTWTPDTPDWYQYSLKLYQDGGQYKWALRNHPGATEEHPWYESGYEKDPRGVPMSGVMNWAAMCAQETDTGAYLAGTGTGKYPGWAGDNGGGACAWDMDWSWGSEVVPLECCGFQTTITADGQGGYDVVMSPCCIPEPAGLGLIGLALLAVRKKRN